MDTTTTSANPSIFPTLLPLYGRAHQKNNSIVGADKVLIGHQPSARTVLFEDSVSEVPFDYSNRDNLDWKDSDNKSQVVPRKHCCCFKTASGCVVSLVTILLLLGVAIFFLFPRIPEIVIGEPFVNNQNSLKFNVSGATGNTITAMSYDIHINFTVNSRNYFDFYTSEIIATGNLLDQQNRLINNTYGYGKALGVNFPALKSTTDTISMTLYWLSVGLGANEDPALVEIQRCTLSSPPQTFHIAYRVRATLPLVSWTGWSLYTTRTVLFNVNEATPAQRLQINSVVNTIIGSVNGTTKVG